MQEIEDRNKKQLKFNISEEGIGIRENKTWMKQNKACRRQTKNCSKPNAKLTINSKKAWQVFFV